MCTGSGGSDEKRADAELVASAHSGDLVVRHQQMVRRVAMGVVAGFVAARDWRQFHNAKDLAVSIVIEAAELADLWKR